MEKGVSVILNSVTDDETFTNAIDWVVLTLPQDKGVIPLENFMLSCSETFPDSYPRYSLVTNAVAGKWQLVCRKTAHDFLKVNDSASTTINEDKPSAFETASSWMNGEVPHAGVDYVAQNGKGGLGKSTYPVVRTPYQSAPYTVPGDSVTLGAGWRVYPCSKDVTFPFLILRSNGSYPLSLPGAGSYLRGKVYLCSSSDKYPQHFQAYMRGLNTVEAEVSGAGTLALNGAAHVESGATATLAVEAGCLRVGSKDALSGVSVTFADGAALLVDPAATGDAATLGAVDLSNEPFGGKLPVAFVLPEEGKPNYSNLAVCTVKDAATAAALTIAPAPVKGCNVTFTTRTNANGTVTVLASVKAAGLMIVIR